MIKLVIFDMDGVLVDACEWHRVALNDALRQVCEYEIPLQDHYSEFNGLPTKVKLNKLEQKGIINKDSFELIEKLKQEKTIEAINRLAFVRKEKIEIMKYLKQKNIKIACYTNSIRKTAELMLEKTGVLSYFDLLVTNQDVRSPKPDPEGYIYCMDYFQSKPENTIIIEDSPRGIEAAEKSGALCIKVKNPDEVVLKILENIL